MAERGRTLAAAGGVTTLLAATLLPPALARWWLTEDAIEYLLIAQQWVHGAGFVNPVQWHFYLDVAPPLPALATRAPMISWLAALPLVAGADIAEIGVLHALLAALVGGALVVVARRFISLPAAVVAALLLGLSPGWQFAARFPWTEVLGTAAFLAVLASAPGAARSPGRALGCAACTWLAWLTRPNLGALALAVLVAGLWERVREAGLREGLRAAGPWSYAAAFVLLYAATDLATRLLTGFAPYAAYGAAGEMFDSRELSAYQKEFVGTLRFAIEHAPRVLEQMSLRVTQLGELLLWTPVYCFAGWLAPAALLGGLRARARLEARVLALGLLGFTAIAVGMYGGFDPARHGIFIAVCVIVGGVGGIDAGVTALRARWPGRMRWVRAGLLVAAAGFLALVPGLRVAAVAARALARLQQQGYTARYGVTLEDHVNELCPRIEREAVVASFHPWTIALWCGNPSVLLPDDLDSKQVRRRFLVEKRVRYVLADRGRAHAWLRVSSLVRPVARIGPYMLWRVKDAPPVEHAWQPAPPLACAGRDDACARRLGRQATPPIR